MGTPRPSTVRAERTLTRAGLWATGPRQLALPIESRGLSEAVIASGSLRLTPDYDLFAWVCEKAFTDALRAPSEASAPKWVSFTFYELGSALYGHAPSGADHRNLRESLIRLHSIVVTFDGFDAYNRSKNRRKVTRAHLIETLVLPGDGVEFDGRETVHLTLGDWLRRELENGSAVRIPWRILRAFDHRQALAKRLWLYLAAERYQLTAKADREGCWIAFGDYLTSALGMDYAQPRQARAALRRAAETIPTVDPRYPEGSIRLERFGKGYRLRVERLTASAVAEERKRVRRAVRGSLGLDA